MATSPFVKNTGKTAAPAKGAKKPMSAAQAKAVANFMKGKKKTTAVKPAKAAMTDPEDLVDGGVDEATEGE
jgi:hypothetical protein